MSRSVSFYSIVVKVCCLKLSVLSFTDVIITIKGYEKTKYLIIVIIVLL